MHSLYSKGERKKLQRCPGTFPFNEGTKEIDLSSSSCCHREKIELIAFCPLHRFAQMKNEVIQSLAFFILTRYLLITTVCNIYIKTVLRNSIKVELTKTAQVTSVTFSLLLLYVLLGTCCSCDSVRELEEAACFSESAITTVYGPYLFCSFSCFSFD